MPEKQKPGKEEIKLRTIHSLTNAIHAAARRSPGTEDVFSST